MILIKPVLRGAGGAGDWDHPAVPARPRPLLPPSTLTVLLSGREIIRPAGGALGAQERPRAGLGGGGAP